MEYADDSTSGNQCTTGNVERTVGVRSEASRGRGCEKRDGNETGFYLKGYAYRGTIDSERELEEVKSHLFRTWPTQCAIMTKLMMPTTW